MKRFLIPVLIGFIALFASEVSAQSPAVTQTKAETLPGVSLAQGITQITGVAVSPLLGVGAIGAWKYATTPEHQRHLLPWYCHPAVWGLALSLIGVCFLKDLFGAAAPALLKKPLDFAELFENKASALVASAAFVPMVTAAMAQANAVGPKQTVMAHASQLGFATIDALGAVDVSWVKLLVYTPLGIAIFAVVWLACHAINVLVAMSPFGVLDSVLKLFKLGLLGTITLAAALSPAVGLIVCVPIIALAAYFSGWAFRLTVFGTLFGWDILLRKKAKSAELDHGIKGFTCQRIGSTPARSLVSLDVNELNMPVMRQRPWLVLPSQEVVIDPTPDGLARGVVHPSVTRTNESGRNQMMFILLPRYHDCVEELAARLGISQITDSPLRRGFKAMQQWLMDAISLGRNLVQKGSVLGKDDLASLPMQGGPRS